MNFIRHIDDLHECKNTISELTRRYHELELELRRLENEREELTAAYKEAEAVSILSFLIVDYQLLISFVFVLFRVAKLKNNVLNVWHPNTTNSVTMLNVVLLKRMKKSKPSGK